MVGDLHSMVGYRFLDVQIKPCSSSDGRDLLGSAVIHVIECVLYVPAHCMTRRPHWFLRSDSCFCCCCSEDETRTDYYTLFKNTNPKEEKHIWRSIRQFDLI